MRVLVWTGTFRPVIGGVEVLLGRMLIALAGRGHRCLVVTENVTGTLPPREDWRGIPVRRFPFWTTLSAGRPSAVAELRERIATLKERFRPDIIHLHTAGHSALFHLLTAGPRNGGGGGVPTLLTLHQPPLHADAGPGTLQGRLLRSVNRVACVSAAVRDALLALAPELAGRTDVVHNGLDPLEKPLPLPLDSPVLLFLGRLVPEKGADVAIDALVDVRDTRPDVRLLVAGDGPEREALRRRAAAAGQEDAVSFLGWVPPADVPALLNRATLVLIPSRWEEPFCLVAVEAALQRRPVIGSRRGGLPEVIEHGRSGWLVRPGSPGALADAVRSALGDPVGLERMGRAARERARRLFGLERCVERYEALYRELAASGERGTRPSHGPPGRVGA